MDLRRPARDWLFDVLVTAVGMVLGVLVLLGSLEDYPGDQTHVGRDLTIGLACAVLLLLFRRRWPGRLALLMSLSIVVSSSGMGVGAMALFSAASFRSWRVSVPLGAWYAVIVTLAFTTVPGQSDLEYLQSVAVFTLAYTVLVVVGMLLRSRRELIDSLRERARQAEEGQRLRVEEARLLERERIAREMHDVLAHRISLLAVHAGALEFHPDAPADQRAAAGVIRRSAYEAMEDLREVIGVLRDGPGDGAGDAAPDRPQPTLTDLPALVEQARAAGAHVDLDDGVPDPGAVPDRVGRHAYRIVQEALTNARKHAPGARVRIALTAPGDAGLAVEIVNALPPGAPAPRLPGAGAGLLGLRERAALLGGMLEHGPTGDGRFRLYAWLPFPVDKTVAPG
ncbi:histidine kinase [Actinomadura hibisca]|uniref:histidine kinase n=1 Tax=Actinomadura hibisca TaxID=68565 RepID=UPI000AC27D1A|nr:histidine kinase [Actinomadura hibisca]